MAINLGPANAYNVFVLQDMNMSNTDAEGRVAVGGNATLVNYGIGSAILPLPPFGTDDSFIIGGDVDVTSGTNISGNTVRSSTSTVINYTMGNPNGSFIIGSPIDFPAAGAYLECASIFWAGLEVNGTAEVSFGTLILTGVETDLNVFLIDATNVAGSGLALDEISGIDIVAPVESTILINVTGTNIAFGNYGIFRNGVAATRTDARTILWNFPQATTWTNNTTAIFGSVLAPFATATTTFSQINGNIIFNFYFGNAESHNELFIGVLPTPIECLSTIASISVQKDVSPDEGVTWYPADSPPGPDVLSSTSPYFRFTVTNTGSVTLTNVQLTDDVYGLIGTAASLAPGASAEVIFVGTWMLGQQVNTATVTGEYSGETLSDSNPAYWVGVDAQIPDIDVLKEVSPNNGVTWFDANTPTGPLVVNGTNPQFRFTVTNTGNVTLTNVTVTDDVFGVVIGPIPSLAPGASASNIVVGVWALGQQMNTADAACDQGVTDTDPAYWFGVGLPMPAIDVEKDVSPNNGALWFPADNPPGPFVFQGTNPQFRFTVTNIGNITLTNVQVVDDVFGLVLGPIPSLAPGASDSIIVVGVWAQGQQVNTATATCNQGVSDIDPAYWYGIGPDIDVGKEVSPNNGITWFDADAPTGPLVPNGTNPWFRFTVTNTGQVPLTNVQVTDDVYGFIGMVAILLPGASASLIVIGTWASGQHVNTVTATCNQGVSATDPAYWFGVSPGITIEKYVSVDNGATWIEADTPPGPLLPPGVTPQFRIVVTNTGDVTLNNISVTDSVFGLIAILPSLAPSASAEWIVS